MALRMQTNLVNDTPFEIKVYCERLEFSSVISAGGKFLLLYSTYSSYPPSFELRSSLDNFMSALDIVDISSDEILDVEEMRVICRSPENVFSLVRIPRCSRPPDAYETDLKTARDAVSRSCVRLKKMLKGVKICRKQCNHLVQACVEGIQKMTKLYSVVAKDKYQIWRLYRDGLLKKLCNSLDRLEFVLRDARDLLKACAKEFGRIALVVSMPPKKNMEVCSMFDLLLGELMWNLDLIEHLLQPRGSTELEWSPTERRYALKRSHGCLNVVAEEKSAGEKSRETRPDTCEDVHSLARTDRKNLQSGLEDGSIFIPETSGIAGRFVRVFIKPDKKILHDIIIKRCKVAMLLDQNHSTGLRSLPMDLESFRIDHLDLKPGSSIGEGTFKHTYEGEWVGQKVAIATMRDFTFEDLQYEVKQLLWLQHPKVVSFFGWAYTDDAPEPIKKPKEVDKCRGGYIVTEKMEDDLERLINITQKRDSGGPFSHFVGLDIVLQIVEAMLHVQKHSVMHRDLKPENFLVNTRSSPKSGTDKYYDVKLIDFGSSKLLGETKTLTTRGLVVMQPLRCR